MALDLRKSGVELRKLHLVPQEILPAAASHRSVPAPRGYRLRRPTSATLGSPRTLPLCPIRGESFRNRTETIGLLLHITHSHREAGVREDACEPERGTTCPTADVPCIIHITNHVEIQGSR